MNVRKLTILIIAMGLLFSATGTVYGDDFEWTGAGDGLSWDDADNWNTDSEWPYPDAWDDNAFIAGEGSAAVIDGNTGDYDGEIRISNVYVSHGDFAPSGGGLEIDENGTLDIGSEGVVYFGGDGGTSTYADNGTLNVNGGTIATGGGQIFAVMVPGMN